MGTELGEEGRYGLRRQDSFPDDTSVHDLYSHGWGRYEWSRCCRRNCCAYGRQERETSRPGTTEGRNPVPLSSELCFLRTESLRILIDCPLSRRLVSPFPDRLPNPRILQKLAVPIIDTPKCNLLYSKDVESDFQLKTIKDDMLCAGFAEGKKDACKVGCTAKVWLLTTSGSNDSLTGGHI